MIRPTCPGCGAERGRCGYCRRCTLEGRDDRAVILPTKRGVPTRALPGSPEKVRVLCERYARGEALFHESDERRLPDAT